MSEPLKILVIEDSAADFLLLRNHLRQEGVTAEYRRIASADEARAALDEGGWDVVLSDYNIPGLDIHGVLDDLRARHPDLPVILISGSIGEERAVELLRKGVCDFILKSNLARLAPAIHRSRQDIAERRARREAETSLRASRVAALNMMEDAVEAHRHAERVNLDLQQEIAERRRADEALRASEARFQRMAACIDDVLYGVNGTTGEFDYISPAFERMLGYTQDDIVGMGGRRAFMGSVIQSGHFEEQQRVFEDLKPGADATRTWEAWWRHKDGTLRCIEDRWIPVYAGERLGTTFGVLCDVTERKREARERDLAVRLLALLNASGDLRELMRRITLLLRDGFQCEAVGIRLRDGDDYPYFETSGLSPEFVRVESPLCRTDPDRRSLGNAEGSPALECVCGHVLLGQFDPSRPFFTARGSFWSNDTEALLTSLKPGDLPTSVRGRCRTEGFRSVALVALRAGGNILGLLQLNDRRPDHFTPDAIALLERLADSIAIGVAHRMGQEQLQRSEERYRRLFEGMSDPVYVLRLTKDGLPGTFVEINGAACRHLGFTREEMLAKSPFDIDPGLTEDSGRALTAELLRSNGTVFETAHCAKDGRRIPVEIRAHIFEFGGERMILCIARDLTERRRLEAQFRQAQKMEAVGQLAGGVAHDFNNILTTMQLQLDLLGDLAGPGGIRTGLQELFEQVRRAAGLTRQLLLFSRQTEIQPAPIDLNEVAGNLLKMLRRLLGEHIDVRFHGKTSLPWVKADVGMMEQVVMNLSVNARDAMPGGGHLTLATETLDVDADRVADRPDARPGSYVCLVVSDTGCGMDEKTLQHIFEPFFTTKDIGQGTGLGLATVYGIVQQHGGWVEVTSRVGQGSEFRVLLPALDGIAGPAASAPSSVPAPKGTETVLLVEDEADVRRVTSRYLQGLGYKVLEAANGPAALAMATRHGDEIDAIYTDMVMPEGMTGLDLIARLRETRPGLPAVLSSGYSADLTQPGELEARGIAFVPKPSTPADMAVALRTCLHTPPPLA